MKTEALLDDLIKNFLYEAQHVPHSDKDGNIKYLSYFLDEELINLLIRSEDKFKTIFGDDPSIQSEIRNLILFDTAYQALKIIDEDICLGRPKAYVFFSYKDKDKDLLKIRCLSTDYEDQLLLRIKDLGGSSDLKKDDSGVVDGDDPADYWREN